MWMVGGGDLQEGEANALRPQLVKKSVQYANVGNAENGIGRISKWSEFFQIYHDSLQNLYYFQGIN